jgi:hypothetical protein
MVPQSAFVAHPVGAGPAGPVHLPLPVVTLQMPDSPAGSPVPNRVSDGQPSKSSVTACEHPPVKTQRLPLPAGLVLGSQVHKAAEVAASQYVLYRKQATVVGVPLLVAVGAVAPVQFVT